LSVLLGTEYNTTWRWRSWPSYWTTTENTLWQT